jgi:hypothetical protein
MSGVGVDATSFCNVPRYAWYFTYGVNTGCHSDDYAHAMESIQAVDRSKDMVNVIIHILNELTCDVVWY